MITRDAFRFFHRLRVRWAEVDMQAVVFNGHYLTYFDVAFTEFWRATGLPSPVEQAAEGREMFARKSLVEYMAPARFDDLIDVGVRCERIGNSSMVFALAVFRDDALLVTGELVYVYADVRERKGIPVPDAWRAVLAPPPDACGRDPQAGQVRIQIGRWPEIGEQARAIRDVVFIGEQRVPLDLEWDGEDESSWHALAWLVDDQGQEIVVGTARLMMPEGRIGRMAVLPAHRGEAIGSALLKALVDWARDLGVPDLYLHAQEHARDFYVLHGFEPYGERFEEAGIPHIAMRMQL